MSPTSANRSEEILLTGLLAAIGLHGLQVLGLSACGLLPLCWIGGLLLLGGLATLKFRLWKSSAPGEWKELCSGWLAPWPWIIGILLAIQIALYPPTMSDSLCYRLPRIFFALQEGGITRFPTADARMTGMPWGWEMLALPFASLNALNASKIINLSCWAIVYQILFSLLRQRGVPHARSRWIALALASAPVFLLQATSTANDLYAATLILVGVWMIHRFAQAPGPVPVMASLLALVLAANAKPQFFVLGLPWLLWWVFAPHKPWKQVPWWLLALAAPLYFLVSPLPLLLENLYLTGNLMGNDPEAVSLLPAKPNALIMIVAGAIQFLGSQLQLPVFPGADSLNAFLRTLPGFDAINQHIPKFNPGVGLMVVVDGASFGLIHFGMILVGIILCIRTRTAKTWPWIASLLFGFAVASSQIVPATIGRSFSGFFVLLLPLAAWGLAKIQHRFLPALMCLACIATGLAVILLNPSSPLWPSRSLEAFAKKREMKGLISNLESYHGYQERARTGLGILDPVPRGETVGILLRQVTPLSPLWQPDWRAHRMEYVNHIDPVDFSKTSTRWLVIGEKSAEYFPEKAAQYASLPGWAPFQQKTYLPNLRQGEEIWTLYRKNDP